jgi:hypothetical protein
MALSDGLRQQLHLLLLLGVYVYVCGKGKGDHSAHTVSKGRKLTALGFCAACLVLNPAGDGTRYESHH